ncbi:MAG: HlyD family secretion protein [Clostridiales bacterium]|nr:HlyD family secretion protein [Clostridiales bacterium]
MQKLIFICGVSLVIGTSLLIFLVLLSSKEITLKGTFTEMQPRDLVDSITVKGVVESVNKKNVYTQLNFLIKEVKAQIGDHVEAGQDLCVLDTEDLALSIEQLKAELDISQKSSLSRYEMNKNLYEEASYNLSKNNNAQVISASNVLESARQSLKSAQRVYDDALKDYNDKTDAAVTSSENTLASAKLSLEAKKEEYEKNKLLFESGAVSEYVFTQSENLYNDALNTLNTAQTNYDNAVKLQSRSLEQAKEALDAADSAYKNASAAYSSALSSAEQDLSISKSNLDSAEIALNNDAMLINIQRLEKQLEDSIIKAPDAGTVTAVFAKEGSIANGLLFVIEDTEHLRISSSVKEYDYTKIGTGMEVIIKSDSTGDDEYYGVISKVAPAAVKNALGETSSSSDVEFGIEVDITTETPLKIGMNTRLELVVEKKTGIYCVHYDSLVTDEEGGTFIFVAESAGADTYRLKYIPVEVGMSTDFYLEILSEELKEGMKVMNDAVAVNEAIKALNKTPGQMGDTFIKLI